MEDAPSIAIVGTGPLGMAIGQLLLGSQYRVSMASRRPRRVTAQLVEEYLPGVAAATWAQAYDHDMLVCAIPVAHWTALDPERLAGHIVVDAMNYSPLLDEPIPALERGGASSSEVLAAAWPGARVVRALNHIAARELVPDARPAGEPDRRALAVAGDDEAARTVVSGLVEAMGFDPVDAGPLARGRLFGPGTAIFGGRYTAAGLRAALGEGA